MFKVSVREDPAAIFLDVEGHLKGPWVAALQECWENERKRDASKPLAVRLCDVSFIDEAGKELLARMFACGVQLEGNGCLVREIISVITGQRAAQVPASDPYVQRGPAIEHFQKKRA